MLSVFCKPVFNKQTSPPFLPAGALTGPSGPCQFCLYPQRVRACRPPRCLHVPGRAACVRAAASRTVPSTTQVSSVPFLMETSGTTMNAVNTWLPTISKGTKKRSLVPFLFTVLYSSLMASSDCLQQAGRHFYFFYFFSFFFIFFSLTHSLVSVLVLLLCFSSPSLERGGGQQEDTGRVVLPPLLAY